MYGSFILILDGRWLTTKWYFLKERLPSDPGAVDGDWWAQGVTSPIIYSIVPRFYDQVHSGFLVEDILCGSSSDR